MKEKRFGIAHIYDCEDDRLRAKTPIRCRIVDDTGTIRDKTVYVTEAEKWVIESLAMRLFLEHRKVVKKDRSDDGKVRLTGVIKIGG